MWIFWALWVAVGGGVELWVANRHPNQGDTLSENVWKLDKILTKWPWVRLPVHFLLAGFLLILIPHFIWGSHL